MNLIRQIQLPNGRSTTNLGFGCGGLMRLLTAARREELLWGAYEAGITHFDVARMYGDGLAEGFVGSALKPVRDRVTIATKFGLPFTPAQGSDGFKSFAKYVVNRTGLRDTVKKLMHKPPPAPAPGAPPSAPTPIHYTVAGMEESLATSLARLQTDYLDLFFIHEPAMHDVIADDLAAALARKREAGQIRAFGVSCGRAEIDYFLRKRPDLCGDAIQHQFDVLKPGDEPLHHPFSGVFGVFGAAFTPLHRYLGAHRAVATTWSDRLGIDLHVRENIGIVILAMALASQPGGMVLFFTSRVDRVRHTVRMLSDNRFEEKTLLEFRRAMSRGVHAN